MGSSPASSSRALFATRMDAHCHIFTDAHLDAGNFTTATRPAAYTLRQHLDGLLAANPEGEIVVLNVAYSALPTSAHVIDSFAELTRLQTLYGRRYCRVRKVLGTVRADEPGAAELIKNPLVVGARLFLGDAGSQQVAKMVQNSPVEALRREGKFLELWAKDISSLTAAVDLVPTDVPLMIDHLGAWAAPAMPAYFDLLHKLAARTGSVMLKGPGHRTSPYAPVVARYVAAAVDILGDTRVVLDCTDAPHVTPSSAELSFPGAAASGPTTLVANLKLQVQAMLHSSCDLSSSNALHRLGPETPPSPEGMIHVERPGWYWGEDVFVPVGQESMHAVLVRPWVGFPDNSEVLSSGAPYSQRGGERLCCIVGSGYTGWVALYPIMLAQELSRRGITVLALEYPPYGRSTGRGVNEINIAQQADDFTAAAVYARDVLGFDKVVGAAWGMGSASLTKAASEKAGSFDGVCLMNAWLDAKKVHESVIASINSCRSDLEKKIKDKGLEDDQTLPAATYAEFKQMVDGLNPLELYPPFLGYPLDGKTLQVVIDELYSHEGYKLPQVRGGFWQELAAVSHGKTKLACPSLVVHGAQNELHTPDNVKEFVQTNGSKFVLLEGVKHNDFMHSGHPRLLEMLENIHDFARGVAAKASSKL